MRALCIAAIVGSGCQLVFPYEGENDGSGCPQAYEGYSSLVGQSTTYRFFEDPDEWIIAASLCEAHSEGHTHLATPDSNQELLALGALAEADLWIGVARDRSAAPTEKASFRTVTGGSVPDLWGSGEPNNTGGQELGVILNDSDNESLNDLEITRIHPFVCECDGVAPQPFDFQ